MRILLIGSGAMSTGIAQMLASSELVSQVGIWSRHSANVLAAIERCKSKIQRLVEKEKLTSEAGRLAEAKIEAVDSLTYASSVDLVIEAISESYDVKTPFFRSLSEHIQPNTIIASNTSSLSITQLATTLPNPRNFIGLHFFNPAPLMELVEVIQGALTSQDTTTKMLEFLRAVGKQPIVVEEAPGFVVNRMLIPMINEAVSILAEGVAVKEDIDSAMTLGAHHPMGPLALADFIGNDVVLSIMDVIFTETGDSKYRAHPLLRKMVRAGLLGQKTKSGFYQY
jgi:3-hydroxybutyryl-CoA dehydrogenase